MERNLASVSRTPRQHRTELMQFVYQPLLEMQIYQESHLASYSSTVQALIELYIDLETVADPYVPFQQTQQKQDTQRNSCELKPRKKASCRDEIARLINTAIDVGKELGHCASEFYVASCIARFRSQKAAMIVNGDSLTEQEVAYLLASFEKLDLPLVDSCFSYMESQLSHKACVLVECLAREMRQGFAGIIFAKTRAVVAILPMLLSKHPLTRDLRIGTFVGMSSYSKGATRIGDLNGTQTQLSLLDDLRDGRIEIIIATDVAEEGIDIGACNLVICFDKPSNLKSFIQRRGRARKQESKYVIMLTEGDGGLTKGWQLLEEDMKQKYMDDMRQVNEYQRLERSNSGTREFFIESTGYVVKGSPY